MKTNLTLALYFLTGSCLISCVLLLLSSSPLKKGEPTITWQISAQDTVPVNGRILKRQTFVIDKDNAKSKVGDFALTTTTTSAPSTVNLTTPEPDNVTTEFPMTTSTENSTTSATTTTAENITTSAATTTSSENTTTSAATTTSSENTTTLPATTSNENNTTTHVTTITTTTDALTTSNSEQTTTAEPNIANLPLIISAAGGVALATFILIVVILAGWFTYHHKKSKSIRQVQRSDSELEDSALWESGGHQHKEDDETEPQPDEYANAVNAYLKQHTEYTKNGPLKRRELGSRMQKHWYSGVCERDDNKNKKLLTAVKS